MQDQNDQKEKIEVLRQYFSSKPEIVMVFAFGSYAQARQTRESDFDAAIFLKEKRQKEDISLALHRLLKREADMVCLNDAPASLFSQVSKAGFQRPKGINPFPASGGIPLQREGFHQKDSLKAGFQDTR